MNLEHFEIFESFEILHSDRKLPQVRPENSPIFIELIKKFEF